MAEGDLEPQAPLPAAAPPTEAPAAPLAAELGTVEHPMVAPPPTGVVATRLIEVAVLPAGRGTAVRIAGDGEFRYSTFALGDPYRFVLDLAGVVDDARRSTVAVDSADVERVRVAQFKPAPNPVSRVVFDLRAAAVPQVERGADGLTVRFGPPAESLAGRRRRAGAGAENGTRHDAQGGGEAVPAASRAMPAPKPPAAEAPEEPAELQVEAPPSRRSSPPPPPPERRGRSAAEAPSRVAPRRARRRAARAAPPAAGAVGASGRPATSISSAPSRR